MSCSAKMRADVRSAERIEIPLEYYFGPNDFKGLKAYGHSYEKVIPLGGKWIGWFTKWVIIPLFDWLSQFIKSFGIIILLMTLFIFPLRLQELFFFREDAGAQTADGQDQ